MKIRTPIGTDATLTIRRRAQVGKRKTIHERNGALVGVHAEVRSKVCLTPPTLLETERFYRQPTREKLLGRFDCDAVKELLVTSWLIRDSLVYLRFLLQLLQQHQREVIG
jgi:hypothetical protein